LLGPESKLEARKRRFVKLEARGRTVAKRRWLGSMAASLTIAAAALVPASASAGSLLSGYGGPGEGNQAILGSALLGGPSAGAGSGGEGVSSASENSTPATAGAGAEGGSGAVRAGGAGKGGRRHSNEPSRGVPRGSSVASDQASGTPRSSVNIDVSKTEVLPSSDLRYILLALAALVVTGVLTRRFVGEPRHRMPGR
jgi:hypothetical protein